MTAASDAVQRFSDNEVRFNTFINSLGFYTAVGGEHVETIRSMLARWETEGYLKTPVNWVTATDYSALTPIDVVFVTNELYSCTVSHTSGVFATDLVAGKWTKITNFSSAVDAVEAEIGEINSAQGYAIECVTKAPGVRPLYIDNLNKTGIYLLSGVYTSKATTDTDAVVLNVASMQSVLGYPIGTVYKTPGLRPTRIDANNLTIDMTQGYPVPMVSKIANFKAVTVDKNNFAGVYYFNGILKSPDDNNRDSAEGYPVFYLTKTPGLRALVLDDANRAGVYTDYGLYVSNDNRPVKAMDNAIQPIVVSSDAKYLDGIHRKGYGIVGPLPARDWMWGIRGSSPNRQLWITEGSQQSRISTSEDLGDCIGADLMSTRLRYVMENAGTLAQKEIVLIGQTSFLPVLTTLNHILRLGQSNGVGSANNAVVTTGILSAGKIGMFAGGIRPLHTGHNPVDRQTITPPDNMLTIVDAFEVNAGNSGECSMGAFAALLLPRLSGTDAILISNHAVGSASFNEIQKGTVMYGNMANAMRRARILAILEGRTYNPVCLTWNGNEGNITDSAVTVRGNMELMQSDFETDANNIMSSPGTARMMIYTATGNNSHYVVFPTHAQGQLDAAINNPTKIFLAGPGYLYNTMPDGVHKDAQGQADTGKLEGIYLDRILKSRDAKPLYVLTAVRTAGSIVVTFHLPYGATTLQRVTAVVTDPGNWGVTWLQTGGTARTITGVAITATNQITVTLSGDPGSPSAQQIGIAWSNDSAAGGPTTGSRSQIAAIGGELNEYACQQLITVT